MLKWLGVAVIVLVGLLITLLGLGYLLKENKAEVTVLKVKLDQQAYTQKLNQQKQRDKQKIPATNLLTPFEVSLQQIISSNLSCDTNKQCLLFETDNKVLGCTVAINTTGAAILIKVANGSESNIAVKECLNRELAMTTNCINQQCMVDTMIK